MRYLDRINLEALNNNSQATGRQQTQTAEQDDREFTDAGSHSLADKPTGAQSKKSQANTESVQQDTCDITVERLEGVAISSPEGIGSEYDRGRRSPSLRRESPHVSAPESDQEDQSHSSVTWALNSVKRMRRKKKM
ncbi:uncharacterized protein KRP23_6873 [Phytophthora ramorum]|uniref:uncharacterized protein n=1 Tax=Phytophthora ramorum TaxID=164328 RepID=UPI0030A131EB|nr:hypothetical protein KRP23_6873 [Phytophthora ramorum]